MTSSVKGLAVAVALAFGMTTMATAAQHAYARHSTSGLSQASQRVHSVTAHPKQASGKLQNSYKIHSAHAVGNSAAGKYGSGKTGASRANKFDGFGKRTGDLKSKKSGITNSGTQKMALPNPLPRPTDRKAALPNPLPMPVDQRAALPNPLPMPAQSTR